MRYETKKVAGTGYEFASGALRYIDIEAGGKGVGAHLRSVHTSPASDATICPAARSLQCSATDRIVALRYERNLRLDFLQDS